MKVALVTGSSRRLGRALVERLAQDGCAVWVHFRTSEQEAIEVQEAIRAAGGTAWRVQGDLATETGVKNVVAAVQDVSGRLDVLVNNVGRYDVADPMTYERAAFEDTLATNLLGPFELIRAAAPIFTDEGASVVNIGYSGLNALAASADNLAYVVSKTGLLVVTRTFADVLGPRGIRVNMVSPGQLENSVDLPADFAARVPLGRAGRLDDVCDAVSWLVSDRASYVTGQNIEVAGGYMLGLDDDRA
ncbi:MAG: SDR family oxidoreductase [Planctomycetes bacterium]|nr:SDR family oxidoreductase [Planctomycetota bacterium]